jgi:hypothetical protein
MIIAMLMKDIIVCRVIISFNFLNGYIDISGVYLQFKTPIECNASAICGLIAGRGVRGWRGMTRRNGLSAFFSVNRVSPASQILLFTANNFDATSTIK